MLFFALGMIISVHFGIEPLVRSTTIVLPIVAIGVVIVVADSVKNFELSNIMPILGTGPYDIFVGGLPDCQYFQRLFRFFYTSFHGRLQKYKKIGVLVITISGIVLTVESLLICLYSHTLFLQIMFLPF